MFCEGGRVPHNTIFLGHNLLGNWLNYLPVDGVLIFLLAALHDLAVVAALGGDGGLVVGAKEECEAEDEDCVHVQVL